LEACGDFILFCSSLVSDSRSDEYDNNIDAALIDMSDFERIHWEAPEYL
jgi:hypothetical protein